MGPGALACARRLEGLLVCAVLLAVPVAVSAQTPAALAAAGWQLKSRSVDPIDAHTLYARPYPGSDYDEYRMEIAFEAEPEEVMSALEHNLVDPSTYPDGFERKILRRERGIVLSHDIIHAPLVFVSDRDVVIRTEVIRESQTGYLTMRWRDTRSEGPAPEPGVVRIPSSRGSWTLVPDGSGGTLVVYQAHVELGGALPVAVVESQMPKEIADQAVQLRRTMRERTLAQR